MAMNGILGKEDGLKKKKSCSQIYRYVHWQTAEGREGTLGQGHHLAYSNCIHQQNRGWSCQLGRKRQVAQFYFHEPLHPSMRIPYSDCSLSSPTATQSARTFSSASSTSATSTKWVWADASLSRCLWAAWTGGHICCWTDEDLSCLHLLGSKYNRHVQSISS